MANFHGKKYHQLSNGIALRNTSLVQHLILEGIDVNAKFRAGVRPMHIVARKGNIATARLLVAAGANVTVANKQGETPLHILAERDIDDDSEFARVLLDAGAKVDVTNKEGETPFFVAVKCGKTEIQRVLLGARPNVNVVDRYGFTPLHMVVQCEDIGFARLLIGANADVDFPNVFGKTALHMAAKHGYINIVRLLISEGANINVVDSEDDTPFHIVARQGRFKLAKLLLDSGVDINNTDIYGSILGKMTNRFNVLYLRYVVKLKCLGLRVNKENMSYLSEKIDEELRIFQEQCKAEIERMKRHEIHEGYRLTVCDVLTKREDKLKKMLFVEQVRLKLKEIISEMSYPAYRNMISMKFERMVISVEYEVKAIKRIEFIAKHVKRVPKEIIFMFISYFTEKDMRHLVCTFK